VAKIAGDNQKAKVDTVFPTDLEARRAEDRNSAAVARRRELRA